MSKNDSFDTQLGLLLAGLVGGSIALAEWLKREPIQVIYPESEIARIYTTLKNQNFYDMGPFEELVRLGKVFSVCKGLKNGMELHVRAIKAWKGEFYLSAHLDYPRKNADGSMDMGHLRGLFTNQSESYRIGHIILLYYLRGLEPPITMIKMDQDKPLDPKK